MRPIAVWTLWSQAPAADGPSSNTTAQTFAMKNSYKVVVKSNQGNAKTVTHDVPAPGSWWGALKIKAVPGARYQLIDNTTGQGPDNIRVKRAGNDLRISFDGREDADLVISDYYEYTEPGFAALIGEADPGVFHAYLPESGQTSALVGNLPDGASDVGMALGGEQVGASGAAVGALVAVAGFNPLLAAPLALLGAGGGGGGGADGASGTGGGGVPDTTPPVISAARLAPEDDTGVSNSDGITADNTPRLLITADPDAVSAEVTLMNGKSYTSTTKNAQGQFVVQIPDIDALGNGPVTYLVVVKDAAGNESEPLTGTPFVVDTSSADNYNPMQEADANKGVSAQIVSISTDTGVSAADFNTADNTLIFKGTVANVFVQNGDFVQLILLDSEDNEIASKYIEPESRDGQWAWSWDNSAQKLGDGTYKLTAQVVDKAGNLVGAGPAEQAIVIDTNANPDANAQFSIAVTTLDQDSGTSHSDFLTNQRALTFHGNIGTTNNGFTGKVLVQVLGTDGKIKSQSYVDAANNGNWTYDNTSQNLGVQDVNTHYVLKASVVDLAGNILKSTDQSFTVDLKDPIVTRSGGSTSDGGNSYLFSQSDPLTLEVGNKLSDGSYAGAEVGKFTFFNAQNEIVPSPNPSLNGPSFSYIPYSLKIVHTDLAGNTFSITNDKTWVFSAGVAIENVQLSNPSPSTFGDGELAGSIGTYILGPNEMALDLSTLHSASPKLADHAAMNHISLSGGGANNVANADHVLSLTTGDVLALGVKNSFVSTSGFKDHQQMRIDGDARDKVLLDDLLGGSTFAWVKATDTVALNAGQNYAVYSNASLGLDLFVQQGIVTTVL